MKKLMATVKCPSCGDVLCCHMKSGWKSCIGCSHYLPCTYRKGIDTISELRKCLPCEKNGK